MWPLSSLEFHSPKSSSTVHLSGDGLDSHLYVSLQHKRGGCNALVFMRKFHRWFLRFKLITELHCYKINKNRIEITHTKALSATSMIYYILLSIMLWSKVM